MLIRTFKKSFRKLILFVCSLLLFLYFVSPSLRGDSKSAQQVARSLPNDHDAVASDKGLTDTETSLALSVDDYTDIKSNDEDSENENDNAESDDDEVHALADGPDYREIFSLSTTNRKYFGIFFGDEAAYNPNIIPHPTKHDMWIVVAQHEISKDKAEYSSQLFCNAGFLNGVLVCADPPTALPMAPSIWGVCDGALAYYNFWFGPRDSRVFYGPDAPYIIYGSQSSYTCLGQWLQDVRMLLQDFRLEQFSLQLFRRTTELKRPPPHKGIEKNYFLFWDTENKAYVHFDISPKRAFARLSFDGSVGDDLAPLSAAKDNVCMAKYLPPFKPPHESIHQATNSLSITLCKRKDPFCIPSDANTFIMTIFQVKSYYDYHSVYEPYVMLFQRTAPFAIHAISQRPLWIHGRGPLTTLTDSVHFAGRSEEELPKNHTEMFYMTSMSWKSHGQKYHGHIDDEMFLAFGIEDSRPAAMDVLAADLLQDLGLCAY